ncbi:histone H3.v1-like [Gouania willdenowi]|uniref:histone H3.v1-like n=1 Tax=Gouania willdenowi TaxID=441366 RepID=UPI00105519D8|nr:histone H3.v1-like [Gouania willdenowi]XP_028304800.1 histone H3.v1-like [Gouania willdenowi]
MGDVDPEDTKSLDSSDEATPAEEDSHASSNYDMVHLEPEEVEMLEEAEEEEEEEEEEEDEMQASVLSILGGEKEEEEQDLRAVNPEEPQVEVRPVEFRQVVPPMALPPLPIVRLHPPSTTTTPVPSTTTSEVEELYSTQGLHPPSILSHLTVEPPAESLEEPPSSQILPSDEQLGPTTETKPLSSTELLCGSAALVAIVGVVAYGAVIYCRK